MADFNKGQTFLDISSTNHQGTKPKYFIALSNANDEDDNIVCFVMNTEKRMKKYHLHCNKNTNDHRFVIEPNTFTFITKFTSIILSKEVLYKYSEMYEENIKLLDLAGDNLIRQIKNCINFDFILPKSTKLIKKSFKE